MTKQELELEIEKILDKAIEFGKHPRKWKYQNIQEKKQLLREMMDIISIWQKEQNDSILRSLEDAFLDFEPLTKEEMQAIEEARKEAAEGRLIPDKEVFRSLFPDIDPIKLNIPKIIDELLEEFAIIKGIQGLGWEIDGPYLVVWVISNFPRDEISIPYYDFLFALQKRYEDILFDFYLIASDDPDMTDVWGSKLPPNYKLIDVE